MMDKRKHNIMKGEIIKALVLVDNHAVAESIINQLQKTKLRLETKVVDNMNDLLKSLQEYSPNLFLANLKIPQVNGFDALALLKKICPGTPAIMLNGVADDEMALELINAGAYDFVLSEHISRLPTVVTRALAAAKRIKEYNKAKLALIESEERFRNLITLAPDPIIEIDIDGFMIGGNPAFIKLLGLSATEEIKIHMTDQRYISGRSAKIFVKEFNKSIVSESEEPFEIELFNAKNNATTVEVKLKLVAQEDKKPLILAICRDITERKKEKELILSTIMKTEDNERKRISTLIHDGLQQSLICTSLQLEQFKVENENLFSKNETFTLGLDCLNLAINESRNVTNTLIPKTVEDNGLIVSLEELISRYKILTKVDFEITHEINEDSLDKTVSLRVYQIIQEAINNSLEHAHPSKITISLNIRGNKLLLEIVDDGIGFDQNLLIEQSAYGLRTMEQKAIAISGEFDMHSAVGTGTRIVVEVPLASLP